MRHDENLLQWVIFLQQNPAEGVKGEGADPDSNPETT